MQKWILITFSLLIVLVSVGCAKKKLAPEDLTTVQGTLKSFNENATLGDKYLELYIQENPTRFRIPVDCYSSFKRDTFFGTMHPGSPITMVVEKRQLAEPLKPATDHVPTVFILELKSGDATFLTR